MYFFIYYLDFESFSSYRQLKDAVAEYEIKTITQYILLTETKNFNKDSKLFILMAVVFFFFLQGV